MPEFKLTKKQREILVGCILGDLHLKIGNGTNFCAMFQQSNEHKDYLFHLYNCFENLCTPDMEPREKIIKINGNEKKQWFFQTKALSCLSFYGNLFYSLQANGKRVKKLTTRPNLLKKLLTPISLAYWFMDDGSQKSKNSKAIILNTHNFTLQEVKQLCEILQTKFELKAKPREQKHLYKEEIKVYYTIYISGHSFENLQKLIKKYIHPSMRYKWPLPRKRKKVEYKNFETIMAKK